MNPPGSPHLPSTNLILGELLADVITEDFVEDLSMANTFRIYQGGSSANVCANLNWLGFHATMVGSVGMDGIGNFLLRTLQKIGLTTEHITQTAKFPTSIIVVGRSSSSPDFIPYRMADAQIPPIPTEIIDRAKLVHTCAFALSLEPARTNIMDALRYSTVKGKQVSIDWNFSPLIWGEDDGKMIFEELCAMHPLMKCSLDDISRFTGDSSVENAKKFLEDLPTMAVCLTCGKDGVWYRSYERKNWDFQPAREVMNVEDTTGAGDAFWAGFLSAFTRNYCLKDCVMEGTNIAAMKVQKLGPLYQV